MVRVGASKMDMVVQLDMGTESFCLSKSYTKAKTGKAAISNGNKKEYDRLVKYYQEKYFDEESDMPIFVNYSTNRAVINIPLRIRNKHTFSKVTALEKAVEAMLGEEYSDLKVKRNPLCLKVKKGNKEINVA